MTLSKKERAEKLRKAQFEYEKERPSVSGVFFTPNIRGSGYTRRSLIHAPVKQPKASKRKSAAVDAAVDIAEIGRRTGTMQRLIGEQKVCLFCGIKPNRPSVEHLIPQSADGGNSKHNLYLACVECNVAVADWPVYKKIQYAIDQRVKLALEKKEKP